MHHGIYEIPPFFAPRHMKSDEGLLESLGRLRRGELTHERRNSQRVHFLQLITFSFFRVRRAKRDTRKWPHAWLTARDARGTKTSGCRSRYTRVHCSHKIWRKRDTARSLSFLGKELYNSFKFFLYYQAWVLWVRQVIPQNIPPTQMISGTHWRYFVK